MLSASRAPVGLRQSSAGVHRGSSRDEARRTQRPRIVNAFAREVGRRGYEKARVETACAAAGVSTRTFYEHFPTKEHCFCAVLDVGAAVVSDRAVADYLAAGGPRETHLRCAVRTVLRVLAENPLLARICIIEAFTVPMALEHLDAVVSRFRHELGGRFVPAPAGVNRTDYQRSLVGGIIAPMAGYVREGKTERLPELEPLLIYMLTGRMDHREQALTS